MSGGVGERFTNTSTRQPPPSSSVGVRFVPASSPVSGDEGREEEEGSRRPGLNRGPAVYETAALPLSYVGDLAEAGTSYDEKPAPSSQAEAWRPVVGYESTYDVSSLGRVRRRAGTRRTPADRILKPDISTKGYLVACLSGGARCTQKWIEVHALVAAAFLGQTPEGFEVDHENRDRTDARLSNLRFLSHDDNMARAVCGNCGAEGHGRCGPIVCSVCHQPGHNRRSHIPAPEARS